jgi:hypothetical protein
MTAPSKVAIKGPRATSWSPYAVGVGIGMLSWFAFATADHGLGITTAFEYSAAMLDGLLSGERTANTYFRSHSPKIDWEWTLVLGVALGSFISSKLSGDRSTRRIPDLWERRFGSSVALRTVAAFAGGAVMMFGARLARGCTSGHGITGALQLAVSSWLFIVPAFAVAVVTALTLYGRAHTSGGE